MLLTCEQVTAIVQTISDEDIYLDVESKAGDEDIAPIKLYFFNLNDEKSQPYFFDQEGNSLTEDEYNAQ